MTRGGTLKAIAAVSQNGVIGKNGDLPWRISGDLQWFKKITMSHVLLMGRKTWQSLPKALPGRENWVLSRTMNPEEGMKVFRSLEEAKERLDGRTLFIIGGGELYSLALADCSELYLTEVHQEVEDGDAFFPDHSEFFDPAETLHECDDFTLRKWLRRESA
jgi:dihydrofolate reductase